jgi:isopenicillin-N N-acyltransferase-like protein
MRTIAIGLACGLTIAGLLTGCNEQGPSAGETEQVAGSAPATPATAPSSGDVAHASPAKSSAIVPAAPAVPVPGEADSKKGPRPSRPPFRYPEGRHKKGSLKYVNGLPVLRVEGTPEEIGEQIGMLALRPARRLLAFPGDMLREANAALAIVLVGGTARFMSTHFPPDYARELKAMAAAGAVELDKLLVANTIFDIYKSIGCSTLAVGPERSATGGALFGRNLDFFSMGYLDQYSLVTVYHPNGKRPFVSVGFPGVVGCLSGMNDAGLALAVLEVYESKDGSASFDPQGVPYAMCYRELLETCADRAAAEKALRGMKRTVMTNLAVCDPAGGAVFESTPTAFVARAAYGGLCAATNHFRAADLATDLSCVRYDALTNEPGEKLSVADIHGRLHEANQDDFTLQTMVFEVEKRVLHLAIGKGPTSALPLRRLDVGALLKH